MFENVSDAWVFCTHTQIYRKILFKVVHASETIYKLLPPKDGWVLVGCLNAGGVVVFPNKPPVVEPVGLELKSEVLLLPKTGVAPLPKLVVVMGLPNADWPNGLFCVAVLNPPKE